MDQKPSTSKSISSEKAEKENFQFSLSAIIQAHSDDAKCVIETPTGKLISGGRDGFMKIWEIDSGIWSNAATAQQKDCLAINSIAFGSLPQTGYEYLIFLGRKNGSVAIFNMAAPVEPIKVLQGHKLNVCALFFDQQTGLLMSGSWDHNAVVWPVEKLLQEDGSEVALGFLAGHKCSVWAVATVPSRLPKFLTASADKSIKLWSNNYEMMTEFFGHTDVVRSLVVLSDVHFFSASNDATIILWDLQTGSRLRNFLPQHDNFIYTIGLLRFSSQANLLISAGEGGCIDIWRLKADATLEHKLTMKLPVESVWSITAMRNSDFAVATSSGMVLVFTVDPARRAPDDIQEFFYSSQYEELAAKEKKTNKAKDPSFDISRFSSSQNGSSGEVNDGYFRRVVGNEFGGDSSVLTYQDPLTGTGRYVPGTAPALPISTDKKKPNNQFVPLREFYRFGLDGVSQKVLNCLQNLNITQQAPLKMTDDEIASASQILKELDFNINECQVMALEKSLNWPVESAVPALDIFRIAMLHPMFNEIFCSLESVLGNPPKGKTTITRLLSLLESGTSNDDASPIPIRILVCRALANAANHEFGRRMLLSSIASFCNSVSAQLCSTKAALQISSATAMANFASILLLNSEAKEKVAELGPREDALRAIISVLQKEENFGDFSPLAMFRLLQAVIMLMWGQSTVIYLALEMDFAGILRRIKDAVDDDNLKALVRDAEGMIQAI